jgi:hypothetical protein
VRRWLQGQKSSWEAEGILEIPLILLELTPPLKAEIIPPLALK